MFSDELQRQLELPAVIRVLQGAAMTVEGESQLGIPSFLHTPEGIGAEQLLVGQCRRVLQTNQKGSRAPTPASVFPNTVFPQVGELLDRLGQGAGAGAGAGLLESSELWEILRYLHSGEVVRRGIRGESGADEGRELAAQAGRLPDVRGLIDYLGTQVGDNGELRSENIPELAAAIAQRQQTLERCQEEGRRELGKNREIWRDTAPVLRNNRIVLPLAANHNGKITAFTVGQSSSGETLFVESPRLMGLNNAWHASEENYLRVRRLVLLRITGKVAAELGPLGAYVRQFTYIDTLFARAYFSVLYNCRPVPVSTGALVLTGARHPLLGTGGEAVPISISFGSGDGGRAVPADVPAPPETRTVMVIGGANAGGKSVTLKCVGLLALLFHWGMELPVDGDSCMPVYTDIHLLIGDQQSIAAHHSTFSGRMERLAGILGQASPQVLLLLDELAGNTDPLEGAAIATAVCDYCADNSIPTLITTHFYLLKYYASRHPGMGVAMMGYDTRNDRPTFHLEEGIITGSRALEIAAKFGLQGDIIKRAEKLVDSDERDYRRQQEEIDRRTREIRKREETLTREETHLQARTRELAAGEARLLAGGERAFAHQLSEARKEIERLVRMLRESGRQVDTAQIHARLSTVARTQAEHLQEVAGTLVAHTPSDGAPAHTPDGGGSADEAGDVPIRVGDTVAVSPSGTHMVVAGVVDPDTLEVASGAIRMTVARNLCAFHSRARAAGAAASPAASHTGTRPAPAKQTLDVRGCTAPESEELLLRQLDSAAYAGIDSFSVIHGFGTGVLRAVVTEVLQNHSSVLQWNHAEPNDGGRGKTIVYLKV